MWKLDLKGSGVSTGKKAREYDESDVPRENNKSEGKSKYVKVPLCNEDKSDLYKGLANVDDAGKGSEVRIAYNINDNTRLDACKGPSTLGVRKIQLLKLIRQVRILAVKPRIIVQQR